ncbi:hypothetical protein [Candidatus Sarmatiella mevalonica]|uniref:hypothetical protein n=1 Tax=Candidatus Sarmatiella mevalonica TaxID=2770581 RepID=UPI001FC827E3|nr:hypothetical protein [Candidatus Sarmatiella mevalonica]
MISKCEEYTKHRAAAYMKYVRTCASTASPQLPSGVELGKRSIFRLCKRSTEYFLSSLIREPSFIAQLFLLLLLFSASSDISSIFVNTQRFTPLNLQDSSPL